VATPVPTPAPSALLALLEADPALRDEICRPDREIVPGEGEVVVPMLLYHFVGRDNLEADGLSTTRYNVTVADFETQLALLHHLGYQTVTVREVVAALLDGEPLPERPIAVTVDDGWMEQYTHLFPILQAYGMRGTFYVPSTYPVGGRFVTWEHLAEMVEAGMEIGSHTRKHVGLTGLDDATLWYELQGSKATLEEHLGVTVDTLSYPFGNYTGRVMRVAAEVGYRGAVAMGSSPRQSVPSLYALHRVEVFGDRPLIDFVSRLPWRGLGTPLCGDEAGRFNGRYD
jgi:peptidoglycan/xylan/chitin deacetylase (PgdA/CDA1 family)